MSTVLPWNKKETPEQTAPGFPSDDISAVERVFPGLRTPKQRETVERIADGLSRNADLKDEDLDDLYRQVEVFIEFAKRKKDSN